MTQLVDHSDVAKRVIEILRLLPLKGYSSKDIHFADFPFEEEPPFGLVVSPLPEKIKDSLNETTDVGYPVQIVRCGTAVHSRFGFESRDDWRREVFRRFNKVRMGGLLCELITLAQLETIELKEAWNAWKLDASVIHITCWIRQPNNG